MKALLRVEFSGVEPAAGQSHRDFLPLAPVSSAVIPDIGAVFGEYTYLASEVAFGTVAVGLLYRVGALVQAARTIAALYPIAYLWDWYTLHIGVFAIELRTGIDLLGIPIEEHIFMVVVPAFVLGLHETLRERERSEASQPVENRQ